MTRKTGIVVYLSGPITLGEPEHNFRQAANAQERLMRAGYSVINPMLTMAHPRDKQIPHALWIANDLPIIERCDAVIRLPGESVGAEAECAHAAKCGVPVFPDESTFMERFPVNDHAR